MHTFALTFEGAWKVLVAGLIFGAGLPSLFAVGIRSMAFGAGGDAETHAAGGTGPAPHAVGRLIGYLCFAIVLAAAALGITYIVATGFGKALSFDHVYPTIVSKH
jgi:hypothetical protein